jgi:hypothetical protein
VVTAVLRARLFAAAVVIAVVVPAGHADAAVVASIDRGDVELNESFTLEVTVDRAIDEEPDVSALEKDFYIVSRSELRNTTIINGQISRSRTWNYVLMAKEAGQFVIPPVVVGNEQSDPLLINISAVQAVLPGESDVYVTAEVDHRETFVQAQVIYRVKVYRAVPTRQPRLSEPDISGVEVLVQPAVDERNYDSIIDGKSYKVAERVYALFPQASGELSIAPALFEARVLRDGRITGRKIFKSEPVRIEVKPIPPPPAGYPDAAWFPANSVELSEEWSREPDDLPAGEPVTRRITVTAVGQLSTQIPVIEPAEPPGIKIYPDKPELAVSAVAGGIQAMREDQYALIAVEQGEVHLPAVDLPWWNIEAGEWQVASLPAKTVRIAAPADTLPSVAAGTAAAAETTADRGAPPSSNFWRRVSAALAAVWLATLLFWWRSRRAAFSEPRGARPKAPPVRKLKTVYLKTARQAAQRGDASEVKALLLSWGRLAWPENPPRNIGDIAARVPDPLAAELKRLCDLTYGPVRESWDGAGLARALGSVRIEGANREVSMSADLPPLMPRA